LAADILQNGPRRKGAGPQFCFLCLISELTASFVVCSAASQGTLCIKCSALYFLLASKKVVPERPRKGAGLGWQHWEPFYCLTNTFVLGKSTFLVDLGPYCLELKDSMYFGPRRKGAGEVNNFLRCLGKGFFEHGHMCVYIYIYIYIQTIEFEIRRDLRSPSLNSVFNRWLSVSPTWGHLVELLLSSA